MKKLFYALILIGLVGCGSNEGTLPENLRMYTSAYDSQDSYGTDEIKPFQGLHGNVKQISYPLHNGGNETITFHRNGFVDEISNSSFNEDAKQNIVEAIKYSYKYEDDILHMTITENDVTVYEDRTYYRLGLPILRESKVGTEKWHYDYEGRLTHYYRNDTLLMEKRYVLGDGGYGDSIEEYDYRRNLHSITQYNNYGQILKVDYYNERGFSFSDEYEHYEDGSYWNGMFIVDKDGNPLSRGAIRYFYKYDHEGNWIQLREKYNYEDGYFSESVRKIIYWESTTTAIEKIESNMASNDSNKITGTINVEEIYWEDYIITEEEIIPTGANSTEDFKYYVPYERVEVKPLFQGKDEHEFMKWVKSKLVYPESAIQNGIQGRIGVMFTISADGSIIDAKISSSLDPELDSEVLRVVSSSPRWKPGQINNTNVYVEYGISVTYEL